MFDFKPRTIKLPCNIGEIEICKKTYVPTPFGLIYGEENIQKAKALYFYFIDLVNNGG